MDRADFVRNFSNRLIRLLQKNDQSSSGLKTRIKINQLAKMAGVSYQMARKYTLGIALPDYHVVVKIAKWLNVSPGWLLFGENELIVPETKSETLIEIESDLLKYILKKFIVLFPPANDTDRIINYIVGVIYDASHLNTDTSTILKIIDMMLSSAIFLGNTNKEKCA